MEWVPLHQDERITAFQCYKRYMQPVVEEAFGWDEPFQQSYFASRLLPEWFYWISVQDERVGLVCHKTTAASVHIHLLLVFNTAQRRGIGAAATRYLKAQATAKKRSLTLNCFKNNTAALALYRSLNFEIAGEDDYFYEFVSPEDAVLPS